MLKPPFSWPLPWAEFLTLAPGKYICTSLFRKDYHEMQFIRLLRNDLWNQAIHCSVLWSIQWHNFSCEESQRRVPGQSCTLSICLLNRRGFYLYHLNRGDMGSEWVSTMYVQTKYSWLSNASFIPYILSTFSIFSIAQIFYTQGLMNIRYLIIFLML